MKRSNAYRSAALLAAFAVMTAFSGCAKSDGAQTNTASAESSAESTVSKAESSTESAVSKDESKTSSSDETGLVGKWVSEEYNGGFVYTFNDDGTGNYDMMGSVMDLTYTIDSDTKMTITFLAEGYDPMSVNYSLEGDKFTISDTTGTKNVFIRQ